MEENKNNKPMVIDLRLILDKIKAKKKLYFVILPVVFVLSCVYILSIPRTYNSSLSLAPEINNSSNLGGTIGSLASSFGFDLGNMETTDAINPMLYPDLMEDNGFVVGLFDIKVTTADGATQCSYYDYLTKHQAYPFWTKQQTPSKRCLPARMQQAKGKRRTIPICSLKYKTVWPTPSEMT